MIPPVSGGRRAGRRPAPDPRAARDAVREPRSSPSSPTRLAVPEDGAVVGFLGRTRSTPGHARAGPGGRGRPPRRADASSRSSTRRSTSMALPILGDDRRRDRGAVRGRPPGDRPPDRRGAARRARRSRSWPSRRTATRPSTPPATRSTRRRRAPRSGRPSGSPTATSGSATRRGPGPADDGVTGRRAVADVHGPVPPAAAPHPPWRAILRAPIPARSSGPARIEDRRGHARRRSPLAMTADWGPLDRLVARAEALAGAWGARARASTTIGQERAILRLFGVHRARRRRAGRWPARRSTAGWPATPRRPRRRDRAAVRDGPARVRPRPAAAGARRRIGRDRPRARGRAPARAATGEPSPRSRRSRLAGLAIERIDAQRTARRETIDDARRGAAAVARADAARARRRRRARGGAGPHRRRDRPHPDRGADRARAGRPAGRRRASRSPCLAAARRRRRGQRPGPVRPGADRQPAGAAPAAPRGRPGRRASGGAMSGWRRSSPPSARPRAPSWPRSSGST